MKTTALIIVLALAGFVAGYHSGRELGYQVGYELGIAEPGPLLVGQMCAPTGQTRARAQR